MWWACCQYQPIHCEWANRSLTWPAMRVIARIKIGKYTHEYTKQWGAGRSEAVAQGNDFRPHMWIETRLTGSLDMKRLIHCQRAWWRVTHSCLWIHQSNLPRCTITCEGRRWSWLCSAAAESLCVSVALAFKQCTHLLLFCKQGHLFQCDCSCHSAQEVCYSFGPFSIFYAFSC